MNTEPPESVPPLTSMPLVRTDAPVPPQVHLVVMDTGGIFGAYLDGALAMRIAQEIEGVVCAIPVTADFRTGAPK